MPLKVKDAMLVKGGNPEPVTMTTWPGSADCGSTVMDAGIAEPIVIGVLAEVPAIVISTWAYPDPNWGIITCVVKFPTESVLSWGTGRTSMPPSPSCCTSPKGGKPEPVMATTAPGAADTGSTLMEAVG